MACKDTKSYFDNDLRAEIWRYYPPTDQWSRVFVSPLVRGVDGFDVPFKRWISVYDPVSGSQ